MEGLETMVRKLKNKLSSLGYDEEAQKNMIVVGGDASDESLFTSVTVDGLEDLKSELGTQYNAGWESQDWIGPRVFTLDKDNNDPDDKMTEENSVFVDADRVGKKPVILVYDTTKLNKDEKLTSLCGRMMYHGSDAQPTEEALVATINLNYSDDPEIEDGIDERIEGKLRQMITATTHELHTRISEANEGWYDSVKKIQKEHPGLSFTSLNFFSYAFQLALQTIMREKTELTDPQKLLEYLESDEGKKEVSKEISKQIKNPSEIVDKMSENVINKLINE